MRDPTGAWCYPILGTYGSDRQVSFALRGLGGSTKPMTDRNLPGGEVPTIYSWMFKPGGPRTVPGSSALLELVWGAQEPNAARVERIKNGQPERTWPNPLQQDVLNAVMKPCFPVGLIGPTDWHDGDMMKTPGVVNTQAWLASQNLQEWKEQERPFIRSDKRLATCPNVFPFGDWYYYICGTGACASAR